MKYTLNFALVDSNTDMQKTIVVCGHGPGISDVVANKFGDEAVQVDLKKERIS